MSRPPMSTTDLPSAVFIDRDGTLMEEAHYCGDPSMVKVIPGVPEALQANLFEPFATGRADGTGLGLSLIHI